MEEENLIQLDYNGDGAKGCTYTTHALWYKNKKMYIIPFQFTLQHDIFVNAFYREYNSLFEHGHYTHCCHRVCANCLTRFIKEGKKCKKCSNVNNMVYSKKMCWDIGIVEL